ncbi:MAG: phenylalanine--tRNA ligase beta subunit-related protein [Nannocystales bacterium]
MVAVRVAEHPLLELVAFETTFPQPLSSLADPRLEAMMQLEADTPVRRSDAIKAAVRDLLRHGGYKPTGRGKPASEYLIKAVTQELLRPINLSVDACNVVSLHSGLPISVVDLERAQAPLHVDLAPENSTYVFNASGQEIKVSNLLCLHDAQGPCANGVKDSQRTKTHDGTTRTLSLVWGTSGLPGYASEVARWYRSLLEAGGAATVDAVCSRSS